MSLTLQSASFEPPGPGVHVERAADGSAVTMVFDGLAAESRAADPDPMPQVRLLDALVCCEGEGWVSIQIHGGASVSGEHGFAYGLANANGRRLHLVPQGRDEPAAAAATAQVLPGGDLRLALVLLAQHDPADQAGAALAWVDTIEITVMPQAAPRVARG
ncbi:hypothetical protein CLD22_14440 [Rubrivivax gelatinosus]|nr:hypothetical protein [Rubrivivax gelatinosus]